MNLREDFNSMQTSVQNRRIKRVKSYHVNVGHGNTSFIVVEYSNKYVEIIGVDCSIADDRRRCESNIEECIKKIKRTFPIHKFELDMFLLTHPHNDHYTGVMYLIQKQYIVKKTEIWLNNDFSMRSSFFTYIKKGLLSLGCKFKEPIKKMSGYQYQSSIDIHYPEKTIIKKGTTNGFLNSSYQEELNPNNASVIVSFSFRIDKRVHSILFTGDLERDGWKKVKKASQLAKIPYHCISHHGSFNGYWLPLSYPTYFLKKAVVMGRDILNLGTYSPEVIRKYHNKLVKVESSSFTELDF